MISRQHHCIFVHIPRTGGASIENVIWPGERSEADLWMGFVRPHYNKYQTGGLQHLYARHIRREVGEDIFHDFFKFAFVRNPWDRLVSQYSYLERRPDLREFMQVPEGTPFSDYIQLAFDSGHVQAAPQADFIYGEDGELLVDFIGRFERLAQDAATVFERIGLDEASLPAANASQRARDYRSYYDSASAQRVADLYARDIEKFNYRFDTPPAQPDN